MKIVGITYYDGAENIVLKSDSSLLVNRKPLFVPEAISDLQALPCRVLRVSRLGKCVAPRFASRYYDAVAAGLDFFGADKLREAKQAGKSWTEAIAFEGSLAVGVWQESGASGQESAIRWELRCGEDSLELAEWPNEGMQEVLDAAVAKVSELLTIRQGDLIYVAAQQTPWQLQTNDVVCCMNGDKEQLYCKVK